MIGDIDVIMPEKNKELEEQFLQLFGKLENAKCICNKVYKQYGKIVKIKRIYARPKGYRNNYYQITYEADTNNIDDYEVKKWDY